MENNGLLVFTIRPVEYWNIDIRVNTLGKSQEKFALHHEKGFSFLAHDGVPVDGDQTYGDTSMTLEWLSSEFPQAEILGTDRSLNDPYQIYVFMRNRR